MARAAVMAFPIVGGETVAEATMRITGQHGAMAWLKSVHLVQHGQGTYDVATNEAGDCAHFDENWADAELTALGEAQAAAAGRVISSNWEAEPDAHETLVVSSPLTRCLQTAVVALPQRTVKALESNVEASWYEAHPCNRRSDIASLRGRFPSVESEQVSLFLFLFALPSAVTPLKLRQKWVESAIIATGRPLTRTSLRKKSFLAGRVR